MSLRDILARFTGTTVSPPERPQHVTPQDRETPIESILAEQVRVLYVEGQRLILTGIAAALIMVWVLWDQVAHPALLGWLAAFGAYSLVRAIMTRAYRRRTSDTDDPTWMTRVQWALVVGGCIWASACFLFYVPDRVEYQLFLVTMLLGAVASGLVTLAVNLPAYVGFVTPFLAAAAIRFGMENDPLHWGIALAATVTFFLFVNFARFIQNSFVESLRLRMQLAERNRQLAERNRAIEAANLAKSRFLAAASHDLRQPLHALNLFVAQLHDERDADERSRLVDRIDTAVGAMNVLFDALLDISKLDAGVLAPTLTDFPVHHLLQRVETTFAATAREKQLRLRVVPSTVRIRSDAILLERILLNLVSNAVRYTMQGGIVIGCRRRGSNVRIDVWDTGIGIPEDQHRNIFSEFYQISPLEQDRQAGLGLGLAIVERLCHLLDHPITVTSTPDKGSRFSVLIPRATTQASAALLAQATVAADPVRGKLVVVIDDDTLVLDGMRGVLHGWGCQTVMAETDEMALVTLARGSARPDLIISDYRLADGRTGFDVIERLRCIYGTAVPAFLITGDTTTERMHQADAGDLLLLHKPVTPMTLRATITQLLRQPSSTAR